MKSRSAADDATLSRELLCARAAAQRIQLTFVVRQLHGTVERPSAAGRALLRWATRRARAQARSASLTPLIATAAWWLLRRMARAHAVRWIAGVGLAAAAVWWIVQTQGTSAAESADDTTG